MSLGLSIMSLGPNGKSNAQRQEEFGREGCSAPEEFGRDVEEESSASQQRKEFGRVWRDVEEESLWEGMFRSSQFELQRTWKEEK